MWSISTIPISRYHVANLSLETPTVLNRHHIRIISTNTINRNPMNNHTVHPKNDFRDIMKVEPNAQPHGEGICFKTEWYSDDWAVPS